MFKALFLLLCFVFRLLEKKANLSLDLVKKKKYIADLKQRSNEMLACASYTCITELCVSKILQPATRGQSVVSVWSSRQITFGPYGS